LPYLKLGRPRSRGARGKRLLFGLFAPEPLKRLAGKPVRLRFMMRDADLYSLQFK